MTHAVNRRQKPAWKQVRKPVQPFRPPGMRKKGPARKISPPAKGR
jgi:hypothetical protein